jgi:hypothetical protein
VKGGCNAPRRSLLHRQGATTLEAKLSRALRGRSESDFWPCVGSEKSKPARDKLSTTRSIGVRPVPNLIRLRSRAFRQPAALPPSGGPGQARLNPNLAERLYDQLSVSGGSWPGFSRPLTPQSLIGARPRAANAPMMGETGIELNQTRSCFRYARPGLPHTAALIAPTSHPASPNAARAAALPKPGYETRCVPSRAVAARASSRDCNNLAVSRQFGLPPERRSRLVSHGLLGLLSLKRLPTLHESQPKCPIAGIARSSGKAAAFIGAPPKLFYTHVSLPADRPFPSRVGSLRNRGRKLKDSIQSLAIDS